MSDLRYRDVDSLHNWLIANGQGFRIESVGIATQHHHLPGVDLSNSIHITMYEALSDPQTSDQLRFFKRTLNQALQALYARCACIRDLAHTKGIVQESELLPYITYSEYNNTVFALWYIHKYNMNFHKKEVMHHAV